MATFLLILKFVYDKRRKEEGTAKSKQNPD
jgi:hypothetical protein